MGYINIKPIIMKATILFSLCSSLLFFSCVSETRELDAGSPEIAEGAQTDPGSTITFLSDSLIKFSSGLDNPYFVINEDEKTGYLYAEVKAGHYEPVGAERTPLNIALVIDRSGSMAGEKVHYVKEAAKFVIDNLDSKDHMSIVIYDDDVDVLFASAMIENKSQLKSLVDEIFDRGSTNLSGGMLEGYEQVKSSFNDEFVNRVLLLSDGLANAGITEVDKLEEICRKKNREKGISISTFGVGADYNEDLMLGLAEHGSGNYYFIETPDQIPNIFKRELDGLLSVVAQNMKMTITLPSGVQVSKVFGYKYEQKGKELIVHFRDVFSEDVKAVLVKFKMEEDVSSTLSFTTKIQWDDVLGDLERKTLTRMEIVEAVSDTSIYAQAFNTTVMQQVTVFEANYALQMAMQKIDEGYYQEARDIVRANSVYLEDQFKYIPKNSEMHVQDSLNTDYNEKIEDAENMGSYEKSVLQKGSKSFNYEIKTKRTEKKK